MNIMIVAFVVFMGVMCILAIATIAWHLCDATHCATPLSMCRNPFHHYENSKITNEIVAGIMAQKIIDEYMEELEKLSPEMVYKLQQRLDDKRMDREFAKLKWRIL